MPNPGGVECLVAGIEEEYHCEALPKGDYSLLMSAEQDDVRFEIPECQEVPDLGAVRTEHQAYLVSVLIKRGATPAEAEEILADLWGDCVGQAKDGQPLLEKYSGKCPIRNWLITVATRRLIDLKRRQQFRGELPQYEADEAGINPFERLPAAASAQSEGALVTLLKDSLQAAFGKCPQSAMLMLRLVYLNGLSQREVGRMWGWHEAKVSRYLSGAMEEIATHTLGALKQRDPWLELSWQDFVELCESHQIGVL
jgi:RNA polymerase sigma factor (sigma-70 family)